MLITMGFYHRKQGLTWQEFSDHWRNVHGPLLRDSPVCARYIRRYVQHHIRPNDAFEGVMPLEFDGFSEVWYDSVAARKEMLDDPVLGRIMLADEEMFIDMTRTRVSMFDNPVVQVGLVPKLVGTTVEFA
jgi:uncharacterized protein (TIGR02118 family)